MLEEGTNNVTEGDAINNKEPMSAQPRLSGGLAAHKAGNPLTVEVPSKATPVDQEPKGGASPGMKRPLDGSPSRMSKFSRVSKTPLIKKTKYEGED